MPGFPVIGIWRVCLRPLLQGGQSRVSFCCMVSPCLKSRLDGGIICCVKEGPFVGRLGAVQNEAYPTFLLRVSPNPHPQPPKPPPLHTTATRRALSDLTRSPHWTPLFVHRLALFASDCINQHWSCECTQHGALVCRKYPETIHCLLSCRGGRLVYAARPVGISAAVLTMTSH